MDSDNNTLNEVLNLVKTNSAQIESLGTQVGTLGTQVETIGSQVENLAVATKNGFDDIKKTMATKTDLETLKKDLEEKYSNRFDVINDQLRIVKNKIGIV